MQQALQILTKYWGYTTFRTTQDKIIQSVLEGNDTFGLMPTGGGKSLCFQVPGMIFDGLTLVISPLIALMKDQVNQLQQRDIKAIALTGTIKADELIQLLDNCQFGNYKFLYLSPERLEQDWVVERIKSLPISLIAIDEAHCVSQWGNDFRPSYLKIKNLKTHFPKTPFIAVTASATPKVQEDIISLIGLENTKIFKKSFARENLGYHIINTEDKLYKLNQILSKNPEPCIIYVRNRKNCHEYASKLAQLGFKTTFYHGGMLAKDKETNMNLWLENKTPVMIATSAFGMGIDKADVKTIIHINLPENLESYYQEAGRAGRNGNKAFAITLLSPQDILQAQNQFINVLPDVVFLKLVYVKLCNYFQIAYGEGINENFPFSLNKFCAHYQLETLKTYNALQFLDRQSIISLTNEDSQKIQMQFLLESREVIRYNSLNPEEEPIISAVLRSYPGIFEIPTYINTVLMAKKAQVDENRFFKVLEKLHQQGIIELVSYKNESKITFLEVREDDRTINRVSKFLEIQNESKKNQLQSVIDYINNTNECKNKTLMQYFGEIVTDDCQICSNCISQNKKNTSTGDISIRILQLLSSQALTSREIIEKINSDEKLVLEKIKHLLEYQKIIINSKNQYIIK